MYIENVLHDRCMKKLPWTRDEIVHEVKHGTKCPHCHGMLSVKDTISLTPFHDHISLISVKDYTILEMLLYAIKDAPSYDTV